MATTVTVKGANVTKYDAGPSGDNIIPDGYVKTVAKLWMDTYTFTAVAMQSGTTIEIGKVPANKKIVDIAVYFPIGFSTGLTLTTTTISLGDRADGARYLSGAEILASTGVLRMNLGHQTVTAAGTPTTITLLTGRVASTITTGTITSVIYYT